MISLNTERLIVRNYKTGDSNDVLRFIKPNKEYFKEVLLEYAFSVIDKESACLYIKKSKIGILTKKIYTLGIWIEQELKLIGEVLIFNIDWKNKKIEIGYYIELDSQKNGYASEAVSEVINYFFQCLDIRQVCAKTSKTNFPSQNLLLDIGFRLVNETLSSYHYSMVSPK